MLRLYLFYIAAMLFIVFIGLLVPVFAADAGEFSFRELPSVAYYTFGIGCGLGYGFALRTVVLTEREKSARYKEKADKYEKLMELAYEKLHSEEVS